MTRLIHRQAPAGVVPAQDLAQHFAAEAAGFKLMSDADFLRNPKDPRDAATFHPQIPNDEFVLKFQKPS